MTVDLSVVIPYRNRDLPRLERCLASLAAQSVSGFEVVFVDYGSEPTMGDDARHRVESHSFARSVRTETRGHFWNRSQALNVGARQARGDYLLTTDVDMIFRGDFLSVVRERMEEGRVLYCRPHFLPRGFRDWKALKGEALDLPRGETSSLGGCQVVSRRLFERLHGFDESFLCWGIEDRDMHQRLCRAGIEEAWLDDATAIFHQWHPPADIKTPGFLPAGLWGRMEMHHQKSKGRPVRNDSSWGLRLTTADRAAFSFVDPATGRLGERLGLVRFAQRPYDVRSVGRVVRTFWNLEANEALAIEGTDVPRRRRWLDLLLGGFNRILRATGSKAEIGYRVNVVHSFLAELIHSRPTVLADYYLAERSAGGFALLVRGTADGQS